MPPISLGRAVYDGDGMLVYQEVIGEACASVVVVPKEDDAKMEVLLVGGSGRVWEYTRKQ